MFDVPCELDNEFGNMPVFSRITELPALEEMHFADESRFDDRRRMYPQKQPYGAGWQKQSYGGGGGKQPYGGGWQKQSYGGGGWRRQMPPASRQQSSPGFSQRFGDSSYWKNQAPRNSLWESDDD